MRKLVNVIFDCDGVLVDSEMIASRVEAEIKCELGFPTTLEEQIEKFVGHGHSSSVMQDEIKRLPAEFWPLVDVRCKQAYRDELKSVAGVFEVVQKLPHPKCVASSSQMDWLTLKLDVTRLMPFFPKAVFSGDMVKNCKPAPDIFLLALERMGWRAADSLVVEDSVAGVTAGKAAGLTVCGFVGGSHVRPGHAERLLAAGADYVVADIQHIVRILA